MAHNAGEEKRHEKHGSPAVAVPLHDVLQAVAQRPGIRGQAGGKARQHRRGM